MNTIVQNILTFIAIIAAVVYLFQKFGVIPSRKKVKTKACGTNDCGCH